MQECAVSFRTGHPSWTRGQGWRDGLTKIGQRSTFKPFDPYQIGPYTGCMIVASSVLQHIEVKRNEVAAARRQVELLEAELRGAEEIVWLLGDVTVHADTTPAPKAAAQADPTPSGTQVDGRRGISPPWRKLLSSMASVYPGDMSLDDLEAKAAELGTATNRNTLRSQMSIYADHHFVDRTGKGRYRLSIPGAEAAGIKLPQPVVPMDYWTLSPEENVSASGTVNNRRSDFAHQDNNTGDTTPDDGKGDQPSHIEEDTMHASRASPLL